ncbi:MAG: hypothetical protein HQL14_00750 [Candidatus Omnitrophica bacterium]|nr:hypothetical protein [Candidatus Omnitrophota bacterium]
MLNLKQQMASFLNNSVREGIRQLDQDSPLARELSCLDVDTVLKEDIDQLCGAMTFSEMARIMALGAQIKLGRGDTGQSKEDLKKMAKVIEDRVESRQGKLKTPPSCRDLLYNL